MAYFKVISLAVPIADAVNHRVLTAAGPTESRVSPCRICGHKVALGTDSVHYFAFLFQSSFHSREGLHRDFF